MSYHTIEHKIVSSKSWKHPLYTGNRVYRTAKDIGNRLSWLRREYGYDNVAHMPCKGDPTTTIVYIRLY